MGILSRYLLCGCTFFPFSGCRLRWYEPGVVCAQLSLGPSLPTEGASCKERMGATHGKKQRWGGRGKEREKTLKTKSKLMKTCMCPYSILLCSKLLLWTPLVMCACYFSWLWVSFPSLAIGQVQAHIYLTLSTNHCLTCQCGCHEVPDSWESHHFRGKQNDCGVQPACGKFQAAREVDSEEKVAGGCIYTSTLNTSHLSSLLTPWFSSVIHSVFWDMAFLSLSSFLSLFPSVAVNICVFSVSLVSFISVSPILRNICMGGKLSSHVDSYLWDTG